MRAADPAVLTENPEVSAFSYFVIFGCLNVCDMASVFLCVVWSDGF
jgi:hypothetical protein